MGAYLGPRGATQRGRLGARQVVAGGHGHWYPGKISKVNKDGTYTVAYNDGDVEDNTPTDRIKKVVDAGRSSCETVYVL